MKRLLAAIASVILLQPVSVRLSAQAVEEKVPAAVSQAHAGMFPDGNLKKWEVRREGYIARFKKDGRKYYAYYSQDGQWKGTESPVRRTRHLPHPVKTAWEKSGYADWYVHNIKRIETPDQRLYVMHVNNASTLDANKVDAFKVEHVLYFTSGGKLVRTVLL